MEKTAKKRTSSRCREWERQRRLKFNDAISKLGAIVRSLEKANNKDTDKEGESLQFPKIEIIQRAIICLESCNKENTQLRADILALQVSLEHSKTKKDVATQVHIIVKKVKPNNKKMMKVMMLQKSEQNNMTGFTNNICSSNITASNIQRQPILLPKCDKRPENTYVVLPSPYIFPQRPMLFPPMPPTFVLVDPNELNKTNVPIVNKNLNDITKTTMVNILPISAYSRPLSANKTKKTNAKQKTEKAKKTKAVKAESTKTKADKSPEQSNCEPNKNASSEETSKTSDNTSLKVNDTEKDTSMTSKPSEVFVVENPATTSNASNAPNIIEDKIPKSNAESLIVSSPDKISKTIISTDNSNTSGKENEATDNTCVILPNPVTVDNRKAIDDSYLLKQVEKPTEAVPISSILHHQNKVEKDKAKEPKISNILDTSLCESAVDAGNARLELAEELLAASPTAAFLMSFPLVSGNRADSPAEEPPIPHQVNVKDSNPRRNELNQQPIQFYEKAIADIQKKTTNTDKVTITSNHTIKLPEQQKYLESNLVPKSTTDKIPVTSSFSNENPFLPMPSLITSSSVADTNFGIDFDCSINKSLANQTTSYANNNFFYKNDPFNTVKSSIYSTSNITPTPDFNNIGLYPCAVDKYNSKSNSNVEDNFMKIGSSRLTYDIDLGWSHKSLDFVNCTSAPNTFTKDNVLTTTSISVPYSSSYNPFNPEFHVPLVSSNNKKESASKASTSFADISNFYSQAPNIWSEDVSFYSSNKSSTKQQNFLNIDYLQPNTANNKQPHQKQYETKQITESVPKPPTSMSVINAVDKFTKKTPTKTHINWMTSEIRSMQSNFQTASTNPKPSNKTTFTTIDMGIKKPDSNDANYFPIQMHNFTTQAVQEEFPIWPSTRGVGTAEISMEPPPINLPTLVGDLALGPHEKKKTLDTPTKVMHQNDVQNCGNFLSVTQLMNRSSETSRYQGLNVEINKPTQNVKPQPAQNHITNDVIRKQVPPRQDNHIPCYSFGDNKLPYDSTIQFTQQKQKPTKIEKSAKSHKNSYSAESLIRSGASQKIQDNNENKFVGHLPGQKFNDFTGNDVAQVSHFPPIIDYSDNTFVGQQFSGTTLYNTTTNTLSNSFYTNLMPSNSNIMPGNFTSAPFSSDFIDYTQTPDCNFNNHKYDDLKMRNNQTVFQQEKVPPNYKNSRRESAAKHKLDCSKKETSKKYHSKRAKVNTDVEEWSDAANLWQNKNSSRRHNNFMPEELAFPNYNQMPSQYQTDFFNSHLMPTNMQSVGPNVDRSLGSFPITSRANFNLSTIFPEITMKVQS